MSATSSLFAKRPRLYYVNVGNDSDLVDNQYTTAPGSAANDGLSPETPVDSLQTLLGRSLAFRPGDIIYLDHGVYEVSTNIQLTSSHIGLTIQGPTETGKSAILDRANTAAGSYVFELLNASDITLANLGITGAHTGVFVPRESDSDRLVIRDSEIFANAVTGISLDFYQPVLSEFVQITDNAIHDNPTGIIGRGHGLVVSGNRIYGNDLGIEAMNFFDFNVIPAPEQRMVIAENHVFNNQSGITIQGEVDAIGNQVMGHSDTGIRVNQSSSVRGNIVFDNEIGILLFAGLPVKTASSLTLPVYNSKLAVRPLAIVSTPTPLESTSKAGMGRPTTSSTTLCTISRASESIRPNWQA